MERDTSIGTFVSPGIKEGEKDITHFLIQAKQTIRFTEEEAENFEDEIFAALKDFNCQIFSNLKGVDIWEEELIEKNNYDNPKIEEIRRKLSDKIVQTTNEAYERLEQKFEEA